MKPRCLTMKLATFFLLLMASPGLLLATPREKRILNLPRSSLDEFDIEEVVESHNEYRRLEEAADMEYMSWDQELADAAQAHVEKCVLRHGTLSWPGMSFDAVGQNMFYMDSSFIWPDYVVSKFYNEVEYYDYDSSTCQPGKICGHYLQVVWGNTNKVGCGSKVCSSLYIPDENRNVSNAIFFTCNYNPPSFSYLEKPYKRGEPCTRCSSGRQWCDDGLCRDRCNLIEDAEDCECDVQCENCGVKNYKDCSCSCPDGYVGTACESECSDLSPHCGTSWPAWTCDMPDAKDMVGAKCPKMCGLCKPPTIDTSTCRRQAKRLQSSAAQLLKRLVCGKCVDADPANCQKFKNKCSDPKSKRAMESNCAKTCGTCTVPKGCK